MDKIKIDLKASAESSINQSTKGIVMLVLDDSAITEAKEYRGKKKVTDTFSSGNKKLIDRCFTKYGIKRLKVVCYDSNNSETISDALKKINGVKFNYLACPSATTDDDKKAIKDFIQEEQNNKNYTVKAVIFDYKADYENVVSVRIESINIDGETITGADFTVDLACLRATCPVDESLTNRVLSGVSKVVMIDNTEDEDTLTENGYMFVKYDNDFEAYVLSDDINTKTTIDASKEKDIIRQNRTIDILDMIRDTLKITFKVNFQSKIGGSYSGRKLVRDSFNTYFRSLARTGVLNPDMENKCELDVDATREYLENEGIDTSAMENEDILKYDIGNKIFLKARVYVLQTIEELNLVLEY